MDTSANVFALIPFLLHRRGDTPSLWLSPRGAPLIVLTSPRDHGVRFANLRTREKLSPSVVLGLIVEPRSHRAVRSVNGPGSTTDPLLNHRRTTRTLGDRSCQQPPSHTPTPSPACGRATNVS